MTVNHNPKNETNVPTLESLQAEGKKAAVVFWVGCAGKF